ncbi:hypothetical protein pb186bvf_009405 [Paramecium bursaria]
MCPSKSYATKYDIVIVSEIVSNNIAKICLQKIIHHNISLEDSEDAAKNCSDNLIKAYDIVNKGMISYYDDVPIIKKYRFGDKV